jgi:hypothetical protein
LQTRNLAPSDHYVIILYLDANLTLNQLKSLTIDVPNPESI